MYRAKASGAGQFQVFDPSMHQNALVQLLLQTEMRFALERRQFVVHYQPIVDLATNKIVAFESLVRWSHPERGLVPPVEFIPAAEENGLIVPLGRWVLEESCRQLKEWQRNHEMAADVSVSVNLSVKQFLHNDLADLVTNVLTTTGLEPAYLKLEITESHVMENAQTVVETMRKLARIGVQFSLDDFGTGYSSLSYLHQLPAGYLKIDRSFVSKMTEGSEHREIVATIVRLGQSLNMRVIAEGVETADQIEPLRLLGCDQGQGYFFGRPTEPAAAIAKLEGYADHAVSDDLQVKAPSGCSALLPTVVTEHSDS
jgi:Amt family ammonium transporter